MFIKIYSFHFLNISYKAFFIASRFSALNVFLNLILLKSSVQCILKSKFNHTFDRFSVDIELAPGYTNTKCTAGTAPLVVGAGVVFIIVSTFVFISDKCRCCMIDR
jgi:hypothetical protein